MRAAIEIAHLSKTFRTGKRALDNVSLTIQPGEMVALIGASGSGKSTLLRHVAGLMAGDREQLAQIAVGGRMVQQQGRIARGIRATRANIGFIFQQFNLVGRMQVITNVLAGNLGRMPLWRSLFRLFTDEQRRIAVAALDRVGIVHCSFQRASTLSGGQQQRAAIARALVQQAEVILADEPIASLDPESSRKVMETLAEINRTDNVTVVVSLHQVDFALKYCGRVVALRDGKVMYDGAAASVSSALLRGIYGNNTDLDFGSLEGDMPVPADDNQPAGGTPASAASSRALPRMQALLA
ncbi:phosphonate ABC transporter ATP-binding protein [Ferrovibrio sp.]|uniref:phosphonate ABC transporter ATP-binding protein n=1 Tax=Ferrovibrio sp. TaxID=1917215 RepID=UPI00311F3FAE